MLLDSVIMNMQTQTEIMEVVTLKHNLKDKIT